MADPPIIDPTKNVLDTLNAAIRRQDDLREAEARRQDELREKDRIFSEAMRDAEKRRLDDLREQLKENKADASRHFSDLDQFRWESGGKSLGQTAFLGWLLAAAAIGGAVASAIALVVK